MKIANVHNVPQPLVTLASKEYYSKGKSDYSVTELMSPPRVQRLRKQNDNVMVQDVSEMLWPLLGSALHVVMERGETEGWTSEERLFTEVDGVTISGAIDLQEETPEGVGIVDYKFTSAWALRQDKPEWEAQQNIYAWLVETVKKTSVTGIQICALIRDWSRREAALKPDYPQAPIQVINLPLWPISETEDYIRDRINIHRESKVAADWGDDLPPCTDEERWVRGEAWAVMREGKKRATKVCDTEEEAKQVMATIPEKEKPYIEKRPGEAVRCANDFCGVSKWCSQYQASLKGEQS